MNKMRQIEEAQGIYKFWFFLDIEGSPSIELKTNSGPHLFLRIAILNIEKLG